MIDEKIFNPQTGELITLTGLRVTEKPEFESVEVDEEERFCHDCHCIHSFPIYERREIPVGTTILSVRRADA